MSDIQCVVVTPEKTELDVRASSVTVPMFDGEFGVLKGHSPLVGRLGFGVLRIHADGSIQQFFVEEGLVQVNNNVVTILTDKVLPLANITADSAKAATEAAVNMPSIEPEQQSSRRRAMQRAQALTRIAVSSRR